MDKIIALTNRQQDVLAALAGRDDGVPSSEIARSLGVTTGYACEVLRSLRDLGQAACSSNGRFARWGLPPAIVALRATNAAPDQMLEALAAEIERLRAVALQHISHSYEGGCPDDVDQAIRDPNCPACQVLGPNV